MIEIFLEVRFILIWIKVCLIIEFIVELVSVVNWPDPESMNYLIKGILFVKFFNTWRNQQMNYRKNSKYWDTRPATVVVFNIKQFYFTMK